MSRNSWPENGGNGLNLYSGHKRFSGATTPIYPYFRKASFNGGTGAGRKRPWQCRICCRCQSPAGRGWNRQLSTMMVTPLRCARSMLSSKGKNVSLPRQTPVTLASHTFFLVAAKARIRLLIFAHAHCLMFNEPRKEFEPSLT
jgi:hypothetical protein